MHNLDIYIEELKREKNECSVKTENLVYASARHKFFMKAKKEGLGFKVRVRSLTDLRKKLKREGHRLYTYKVPSINIYYSRYADDFVLGLNADKDTAKRVQTSVYNFIKSNLHLSISEKYLYHSRSDKTR